MQGASDQIFKVNTDNLTKYLDNNVASKPDFEKENDLFSVWKPHASEQNPHSSPLTTGHHGDYGIPQGIASSPVSDWKTNIVTSDQKQPLPNSPSDDRTWTQYAQQVAASNGTSSNDFWVNTGANLLAEENAKDQFWVDVFTGQDPTVALSSAITKGTNAAAQSTNPYSVYNLFRETPFSLFMPSASTTQNSISKFLGI